MNTNSQALTYNDLSFSINDFIVLLKPRVMLLVVFTGFVGLVLAPGDIHPVLASIALLCLAGGAGAAAAFNMWYDRDIDALMNRTADRPLPAGRLAPETVLGFSIMLGVASVTIMGLAIHWTAAAWLAFSIFFYAGIYTTWLKRVTPQNIVIGGAAGAFPPVIGWVVVTGTVNHLLPWLLFAIIFLWTPPHFWALALNKTKDYTKAKIPMLPVVAGVKSTLYQIVFYSLLLVTVVTLPWVLGYSGNFYGLASLILNLGFLLLVVRLCQKQNQKTTMGLFGYSILYLFLVFVFLLLDGLK